MGYFLRMSDSSSDSGSGVEEGSVDLEKVTIWYRCKVCNSYLCSIPNLRKHAASKHNISSSLIQLPNNLPPGAEEGKIYFTYELNFNKAPPSYSYEQLHAWKEQQSDDILSKNTQTSVVNSCSNPKRRIFPPDSPSQGDWGIRLKPLPELLENSSSDEENNAKSFEQRNPSEIPSPPSLVSPPNSDEEGQLQISAPVTEAVPLITQVKANSSSTPQDGSTQAPSTTKPSIVSNGVHQQSTKLPCSLCSKTFNNASSLNFHKKKFHLVPVVLAPVNITAPDNVAVPVLTFQRDTNGNYSSITGSKNKPETCEEESQGKKRKRSHQLSTSSDSTSTKSPVALPQAKKTKQLEETVAETNKSQPAVSKRKPGPKSRISHKSASESDTESEVTPSLTSRSRSKILSSESEDHSVSGASEITLPVKKRIQRRKKETSGSDDVFSSPEVISINTRARRASRQLPSASESSASASSNQEDDEIDESDDTEQSEGEMSDKSTTSDDDESLQPPSRTYYGNDDEDGQKKKGKNKNSNETEKTNSSSDGSGSSSSEDLFIPIPRKRKKRRVKGNTNESETKNNSVKVKPLARIKPTLSTPRDNVETKQKDSKNTNKTCKTCLMECKSMIKFIQHLYSAHPDIEHYYSCGFCNQRFSTKMKIDKFNDHVAKHNSDKSGLNG